MNPRTQRRRNLQRHRSRARHQALHPHALATRLQSNNLLCGEFQQLSALYDAGCTLENQMSSRSIPVEFSVSINGWPAQFSQRTQGRRLHRLALKRHKILVASFDYLSKVIGRLVAYTRVRHELLTPYALHQHYRFVILYFIPRASINAMANPVPLPTFCCNVVDALEEFLACSSPSVDLYVENLRYPEILLLEDALVPVGTTLADLGFNAIPVSGSLSGTPQDTPS